MTRRRADRLPAVPTVAALCTALFASAAGAETSPYYIGLSQTFSHESNLLRLADGQDTPPGYSRPDTVSSTALLAGFDQPFGRQRAYANLNLRSNRYSENSVFNNMSYSASAGLDWSTIERLSGSLTANANRSLQRFNTDEFATITQKNLESSEVFGASMSLGVVTQYTLELSGNHRQVSNSLQDPNVQAREFNSDNASLGLRWRPSSATSLALALGVAQGRYPKFRTNAAGEYEADRFKRDDITLSGTLSPSGASTIDARISSGKTRYDLNQQRDFSGVTGSIAWGWQATGKIRTSTTLSRDTGQDSYSVTPNGTSTTADYSRVTNTLRLQSDYAFSAKVFFTAGLTYYDRLVVRTIGNSTLAADANGRDRTTMLNLGSRWSPVRNVLLGCDASSEKRRASGVLVSDLSNSSFGCYGQISLQ